jgi:hypothetical protein
MTGFNLASRMSANAVLPGPVWLIATLLVTLILGPPILSHGYTMLNASLLSAPALYCWSIQRFGARHAHS